MKKIHHLAQMGVRFWILFIAMVQITSAQMPTPDAPQPAVRDGGLLVTTLPTITVPKGASVALFAYVREARQPCTFAWTPLPPLTGQLPQPSSQLSVFTALESGSYRCEVTDAVGNKAECITEVRVTPTTSSTLTITRACANGVERIVDFRILCCSMECQPAFGFTREDLLVQEDGRDVTDLTLTSAFFNPLSAALVLDVSGSMVGQPMTALMQAATQFVSNMDGVSDEASLHAFSTTTTLLQPLTTNQSLLTAAVNGLTCGGATAVWDAGYEGVVSIAAQASNPNRIVVLMTDGMDNSSSHSMLDVLTLAVADSVRIFTIALGIGDTTQLKALATGTGGEFLKCPTSTELAQVFGRIFTIARTTPGQDCRIAWRNEAGPPSPGASISITTRNLCDGATASATTGIATAIDQVPSASVPGIWPEPSDGRFCVQIPADVHGPYTLTVHDLLGREIHRAQGIMDGIGDVEQLDLRPAGPGWHVLTITSGGRRWSRGFTIR